MKAHNFVEFVVALSKQIVILSALKALPLYALPILVSISVKNAA
jgi:hypothetical protein